MPDCLVTAIVDFGKGPVETVCVRKDVHWLHRFEDPEPELQSMKHNIFDVKDT